MFGKSSTEERCYLRAKIRFLQCWQKLLKPVLHFPFPKLNPNWASPSHSSENPNMFEKKPKSD